jgi:DNA-binding response OmpR family regulator
MAASLTYAGFLVVTARDGAEALDRARESAPELALLDVMMPGMDGREVCRRMGVDPELAQVPVILQSAADERDIDWRACGAVAFLSKPFNLRELPNLVRRHLTPRNPRAGRWPRRLTDDEIRTLARVIMKAARERPDPNARNNVLSPHRELSRADEARVEAALVTMLSEEGKEPTSDEGFKDAGPAAHRREERGDDDRDR